MNIETTDLLTNLTRTLQIDEARLPDQLVQKIQNGKIFSAPGMVDLQINGYRSVDFNSPSLTVHDIVNTTQELLNSGVTGFLPTLITNDPKVIERNLNILDEAAIVSQLVQECMLGIHMEGPFISKEDGGRGAHPLEWIMAPDIDLLAKWQKISGNRIKLITFSPEYNDCNSFIEECMKMGMRVAIGHTMATAPQIHEAVSAGASLSTHLGNALPQKIHRQNNPIFSQLSEDRLYASIIADGHHLSKESHHYRRFCVHIIHRH